MSSCSNSQPAEAGSCYRQKAFSSLAILSEGGEGHLEPEDDEEEDVDFNPFLKEPPLSEASSSLSSENEGLDAVVDNAASSSASKNTNLSSKLTDKVQDFSSKDSENEEVVMQTKSYPKGAYREEVVEVVPGKLKKRKPALTLQPEMETVPGKENASTSGTDAVDVMKGASPDLRNSGMPIMVLDDEDAICRRTRARYSLANFTLDELETFLQGTDDDEDLQNVDDEEEYRKFLAAVLQGGDGEDQRIQENGNVDDEDEENDADFEIEIEEALESDLDESTLGRGQKEKHEGVGRRPETRQNRHQKTSAYNKKKLLGQAKRPLRPLLPVVANTQMAPFPALDLPRLTPESMLHSPSSFSSQACVINGFTPHQIGQLYCLVHEHMQLLIQVFSLCVLEPSRQHIATEVQRMISEMVHKRDEVLARRNVSYPGFCFSPPNIHPSVSDGCPKFYRVQNTVDSSFVSQARKDCPMNNMIPVSPSTSHSDGRLNEHIHDGRVDPLQSTEESFWVPLISGPVLSVLDVAPLSLAGGYIADVAAAVQEYQQRRVEAVCDYSFQREPLFPLPNPLFSEANSEVLRGSAPLGPNTVPSSSPGHQQPKKTLAAALVESTKKQSVALVPKEIVKLVNRFFPLFNSALFPHKPPPAAVANRVLFTDAEDELLAMGLMEYNTDWKAIQQRFLPCKSKHQIFVRQKNRSSSKAPENPIKAVRRMKTSPLTAEETARINEALRVLKLDWMSIWKFIVPYRDPSLLPRQWRIALGTQKSYKTDAAKKEKRRLYESMRRKCKAAAALAPWQTALEKEDCQADNADGGNNSGDYNMDDEDEAYVHEAFLADWRPGNSCLMSTELPLSSLSERNLESGRLLSQEGAHVDRQLVGVRDGYGEPRTHHSHMHEFLPASNYSPHLQNVAHFTHVRYSASYTTASSHLPSNWIHKSSKGQVPLRPYRVRRSNVVQSVKLAPDLPPVNLPPSVRVISQSAFKSYCCGSSSSTKVSAGGGGGVSGGVAGAENLAPRLHFARSGTIHSVNAGKNRIIPSNHSTANSCAQDPGLHMGQHVTEGKGAEMDFQMHPLLFQAPEDGRFPYYPLNCGATASSTFSFLPGNQLQANFDLFHKPQDMGSTSDCFSKSLRSKEPASNSCTIEFHPLLQKPDDVNSDSVPASSACHLSVDLESFQGNCTQLQNPSNSVLTEPEVNGGPFATCTRPSSPYEKTNELDLEIHLSSTSRKEKVMGNRNMSDHNSNDPRISALNCGTTTGSQMANGPSYQSSKNCLAASVATKESGKRNILGTHSMVLASNNVSGYTEDNTREQSLPEIVMEQEELSDSDEEIGEHVEFECEEMTDSEGEETDSEQLVNIQNKEIPPIMVVEEVLTNADCDDQQYEPRICGPRATACDTTKGKTRSSKAALTNKQKDTTHSTLQLSLDSCTLGSITRSKLKREQTGNGDDQTSKSYLQNGLPSRPNRSCKRMMPNTKGVPTEPHHLDMPKQIHVGRAEGTVIFAPMRKPRKRVCRNNSITGNPSCVSSDILVDCQSDDTSPRVDEDPKMAMDVSSSPSPNGGSAVAQVLK